ncbi:MAG: transglutaminase domain-containing protein [Lachnospiraceae bacterium]|nr:transglutaminase domain-containing protein [Lachnospiraceae bacterium]
MRIDKKEQQIIDYSDICGARYGIVTDLRYTELTGFQRFQVCLMKGLLIFCCVYGSLCLFITSFDLPCIQSVIFISTLVFSLIAALFYHNRVFFNVGYIMLFVAICAMSFALYAYANSGINAVLNSVLKVVDDKMHLNGVREYTEMIKNRRLTITCCLLLVSYLNICFFNSSVSGYTSPFLVFVLLFPVVQICIYFDEEIDVVYFGMLLFGFLGTLFVRLGNRYHMPYKGKSPNVRLKGERVFRSAERFVVTMRHMLMYAAVVSVVVLIVCGLLTNAFPRRMRSTYSSWKDTTDVYVKQFAMSGFLAFFNQYQSTGGMNEGRLGGVREVGFDMETDLVVKMVPGSTEPMYLRAFVGDYYEDNQWYSTNSYTQLSRYPYGIENADAFANKESNYLLRLFEENQQFTSHAILKIQNVDANPNYLYAPYYTVYKPSELNPRFGSTDLFRGDVVFATLGKKEATYEYYSFDSSMAAEYYLNQNGLFETPESGPEEMAYRSYAYNNYLKVPKGIKEDLQQICERYITSNDKMEIISQIMQYFYSQFTYTQSPGITPPKRDFVVYFLKQQKRGFCAHFATAAAMLLRTKGIPARYVEGYCISFDDTFKPKVLEGENADEWYQGYNAYSAQGETPQVLSVEVTDASAHAWVEVYFDGFGWVPIEFTVADWANNDEGGFWTRFGNWMITEEPDIDDDAGVNLRLRIAAPIVLFVILMILLAVMIVFYVLRIVRMYRLYYAKDNRRLVNQYQALTKLLRSGGISEENNLYHEQTKEYLRQNLLLSADDASEYISLVERASFSREKLSVEELERATCLFKDILNAVQGCVSRSQRLKIRMHY